MFKDSTGSALSSDSSVNCFITVVQQKFRSLARLKLFSLTTITKLFTEKSELNALPAGC